MRKFWLTPVLFFLLAIPSFARTWVTAEQCKRDGLQYEVYLDGHRLKWCIEADVKGRYAVCIVGFTADNNPILSREFGIVTLVEIIKPRRDII